MLARVARQRVRVARRADARREAARLRGEGRARVFSTFYLLRCAESMLRRDFAALCLLLLCLRAECVARTGEGQLRRARAVPPQIRPDISPPIGAEPVGAPPAA